MHLQTPHLRNWVLILILIDASFLKKSTIFLPILVVYNKHLLISVLYYLLLISSLSHLKLQIINFCNIIFNLFCFKFFLFSFYYANRCFIFFCSNAIFNSFIFFVEISTDSYNAFAFHHQDLIRQKVFSLIDTFLSLCKSPFKITSHNLK